MDEHRFDTLTRRFAGKISRRASLRTLAAAGAVAVGLTRGKGDAAGQSFYRSAGDACWEDDQCVAADTALVCADNGTLEDGSLNCCAFEGSRCGADSHCCGRDVCAGGFCGAAWSGPDSTPTYNTLSLSPGDSCQTTAQCNRDVTGAVCEFTNATGDAPRACAPPAFASLRGATQAAEEEVMAVAARAPRKDAPACSTAIRLAAPVVN
jgi:hypothetical protein